MQREGNINKNEKYLISLLRSVLLQETCDEKPEDVSFEEVFKIANTHSMSNMAYYGILKLKNKPEKNLLSRWKQAHMLGILKNNTQTHELKKILEAFENKGIESVILKGFEIKALYPKDDMREMGDIDILIESSKRDEVEEPMQELGYSKEKYESEREIVFKKKPLMNVEIHTALFDKDSRYYNYFLNMSNMKSVKEIKGYRYSFSPEDSFIYNLAHLALHFACKGMGIRAIVDQWLYRQRDLDWEYIKIELKKLELYEFYQNILALGEVWFGFGEITQKLEKMERYVLNSGLYGSMENYGVARVSKNGKLRSIFFLLFPNLKIMQTRFPILKKKSYLLPVYYVIRWVKLFKSLGIKSIQRVLKSIVFTNGDKIDEKREFFKDIGL